MGLLSRLSIVTKISLIPAVAIISFVIYLVINASVGSANAKLLDRAKSQEFPVLRASDRLLMGLERLSEQFKSAATTADVETLKAAGAIHAQLKNELHEIDRVMPELKPDIAEVRAHLLSYFQLANNLTSSLINGTADFSQLARQSEEMNKLYEDLGEEVKEFQANQLESFQSSFNEIDESSRYLIKLGLIMSAITIVLLVLITLPVVLGIKNNLLGVVNSLKAIAQENGDLTLRLKSNSQDEVGDLVYWFNSFMEKLHDVIKSVVNTSDPLEKYAKNLSIVASDATSAIDAQRANADRAKYAIDEMSGVVDEVASSASLAAEAAEEATQTAKHGQATVQNAVVSIRQLAKNVNEIQQVIHRLEDDSSKVGSVLDVIKGIAEQTNLLALNAAIEAARAGEQGRGFAVVADEVRTLASRTQESTDEIRNTIEKLQSAAKSAVQVMAENAKQADHSVENANTADESLEGIHNSITNINSMNNTIANATREQSRVAQDIVEMIHNIHTSTQNTVERSGQLQDTSRELNRLATALSDINRKFKV